MTNKLPQIHPFWSFDVLDDGIVCDDDYVYQLFFLNGIRFLSFFFYFGRSIGGVCPRKAKVVIIGDFSPLGILDLKLTQN